MLVPEVDARRRLRDRPTRTTVLAPYGAWLGCGTLRVLRVKIAENVVELTVGYESYEPLR